MLPQLSKYPRPLQLSILEGMATALMTGGAMAFVIPFAVLLGATSLQVGFITALPALLAAVFQLGSIRILEFYRNRKQIVIFSVVFQAVCWLLVAAIPFFFKSGHITWLIAFTTIGTVIGSFGSPFWQSWMRSLTPKEIIGEYFGVRNSIIGLLIFITTLICGFALDLAEPSMLLFVFIGIFLLSFAGRLTSAVLFTKIDEPKSTYVPRKRVNVLQYISQLRKNNFGHFILFGTFMTFSIALVAPFVSYYYLEGLGLKDNYFMYTILISAGTIASLVSLPYWGRVIDKFGTIKFLQATGFLVCLYPLWLLLIRDPLWLIPVEIFDGVIFSGFTLCLASFIYESFKPEKIIPYAAFQSVLFGAATFAGTIISGFVQMYNIQIGFITTAFFAMCVLSAILRLLVFTSSVWKIKDARKIEYINEDKLLIKALTIEPIRDTAYGGIGLVFATTKNSVTKAEEAAFKSITKAEKATLEEIGKVEKYIIQTISGKNEQKNNKKKPLEK